MSGEIDAFDLYDVCEADEIYVTAGEKGLEEEDESPRERGLKKKGRGDFESDKPPVLTLVRRLDGRVRFLVRDDLQVPDGTLLLNRLVGPPRSAERTGRYHTGSARPATPLHS